MKKILLLSVLLWSVNSWALVGVQVHYVPSSGALSYMDVVVSGGGGSRGMSPGDLWFFYTDSGTINISWPGGSGSVGLYENWVHYDLNYDATPPPPDVWKIKIPLMNSTPFPKKYNIDVPGSPPWDVWVPPNSPFNFDYSGPAIVPIKIKSYGTLPDGTPSPVGWEDTSSSASPPWTKTGAPGSNPMNDPGQTPSDGSSSGGGPIGFADGSGLALESTLKTFAQNNYKVTQQGFEGSISGLGQINQGLSALLGGQSANTAAVSAQSGKLDTIAANSSAGNAHLLNLKNGIDSLNGKSTEANAILAQIWAKPNPTLNTTALEGITLGVKNEVIALGGKLDASKTTLDAGNQNLLAIKDGIAGMNAHDIEMAGILGQIRDKPAPAGTDMSGTEGRLTTVIGGIATANGLLQNMANGLGATGSPDVQAIVANTLATKDAVIAGNVVAGTTLTAINTASGILGESSAKLSTIEGHLSAIAAKPVPDVDGVKANQAIQIARAEAGNAQIIATKEAVTAGANSTKIAIEAHAASDKGALDLVNSQVAGLILGQTEADTHLVQIQQSGSQNGGHLKTISDNTAKLHDIANAQGTIRDKTIEVAANTLAVDVKLGLIQPDVKKVADWSDDYKKEFGKYSEIMTNTLIEYTRRTNDLSPMAQRMSDAAPYAGAISANILGAQKLNTPGFDGGAGDKSWMVLHFAGQTVDLDIMKYPWMEDLARFSRMICMYICAMTILILLYKHIGEELGRSASTTGAIASAAIGMYNAALSRLVALGIGAIMIAGPALFFSYITENLIGAFGTNPFNGWSGPIGYGVYMADHWLAIGWCMGAWTGYFIARHGLWAAGLAKSVFLKFAS